MNARMEWHAIDCGRIPATAKLSHFAGEFHVVVRPTQAGDFATQLDWISQAYRNVLEFAGVKAPARFRRLFCSDLPNQAAILSASEFAGDSWIGQQPMPPVKVALWAYHTAGAVGHHWTTRITDTTGDTTHQQTRGVFEKYDKWLREREMTLASNAIRTWLFVQNVDVNYGELVAARREFFAERGLTPNTHFIASTGIEGTPADLRVRVSMDAYAISGVRPEQIKYLAALDHLCPTYRYGVTFERATAVSYRDRKHVFISGTASIDQNGQVLHPGNVCRQLERALENVEALLNRAGATPADMGVFIVYIRDAGDHEPVWRQMRERFPRAPIEVIVAPVCRPGWLVEVEGQAAVPAREPALPEF